MHYFISCLEVSHCKSVFIASHISCFGLNLELFEQCTDDSCKQHRHKCVRCAFVWEVRLTRHISSFLFFLSHFLYQNLNILKQCSVYVFSPLCFLVVTIEKEYPKVKVRNGAPLLLGSSCQFDFLKFLLLDKPEIKLLQCSFNNSVNVLRNRHN